MCVCVLSKWLTLVILWTIALQAPLSMGLSREAYWNGLPFPPPEDLPNPGIKPMSLTSPASVGGFITANPPFIRGYVYLITN